MSRDIDLENCDDFLDMCIEAPEIILEMEEMPDRHNESLVEERRINSFQSVWQNTTLSKEEVLDGVKDAEEIYIDEHGGDELPDFALRMAAQDAYGEFLLEKIRDI